MSTQQPATEEIVAVRLARRLLNPGTPYTTHEREHLAFIHLPDILAALAEARAEALDVEVLSGWLDTLTASHHVFPNDKLSNRDLAVFQMTIGYVKRHFRAILAEHKP